MSEQSFRLALLTREAADARRLMASVRSAGYERQFALEALKGLDDLRRRLGEGGLELLLVDEGLGEKTVGDALALARDTTEAPFCFLLTDTATMSRRLFAAEHGCRGAYARAELDDPDFARLLRIAGEKHGKMRAARHRSRLSSQIIEQQGEGTAALDTRMRVVFANPAFCGLFGLDAENCPGVFLPDQIAPEDQGRLQQLLETGEQGSAEVDILRPDRERRRIQLTVTPRRDPAGSLIGSVIVVRDITERRQVEERLRRSEKLHRSLARNIPHTAIFVYDTQLRYLVADGPILEELGYRKGEMIGRHLREIVSEEAYPILESLYRRTLEGHETEITQQFGGSSYIIRTTALRDDEGHVFAGVVVAQDVTPLHRTQQYLGRQVILGDALSSAEKVEDALYAGIEAAMDVSRADVGAGFRVLPDGGLELLTHRGLSDEGRERLARVPGDVKWAEAARGTRPRTAIGGALLRSLRGRLRTEEGAPVALLPVREGGEPVACLLLAAREREPAMNPQATGALTSIAHQLGHSLGRIIADVERRETRRALEDSQAKMRAMLNSGFQTFLLVDREGRLLAFNEAARAGVERILGVTMQEGEHAQQFIPPELQEGFRQNFQRALGGETITNERRSPTRDGGAVWLENQYIPVTDGEGVVTAVVLTSHNITERKGAEEALRESEEQFRLIAENSTDLISKHSLDGTYTYVSPSSRHLLGYEPEELLGTSAYEYFHPADLQAVEVSHETIRNVPVVYTVAYRIRRKDGRYIWFETTSHTIKDENSGEPVEIVAMSRDITERRSIEQQLRASEQRYRTLAENFPNGLIAMYDTDYRYVLAGGQGLEDAGFTRRDLEGRTMMEVFEPDFVKGLKPWYRKALEGERVHFEIEYNDIIHEVRILPLQGSEGEVTGGLLMTQNVTERRRAEEELRRSEAQMAQVFAASPAVIYTTDHKGRATFISPNVLDQFGHAPDDFIGNSEYFFGIIHPDDRDRVLAGLQELLDLGQVTHEYRVRTGHGHYRWIRDEMRLVVDGEGRPTGGVGAWSDITERRASEEQLRLLATAISTAEEAVLITESDLDPPGPTVVFVNEGFTRMSGYRPEEIIGKSPRILQGERTDRNMLDKLKQEIRAGNSFSTETYNYRRDGSEYIVEWRISPVFDSSGRITHYVSIQRDVTTRRMAEQALRETANELAQRNEELEASRQEAESAREEIERTARELRKAYEETAQANREAEQRNRQLEFARRDADRARVAVERAAEELRRAYEDAALARKDAELASEAKSIFLASMSHEIRTPMTAILGYARLLRDMNLAEQDRGFVEQIVTSAEHLLDLINEILDLSRVESGQMKIEYQPFDPRALLDEIVTLYSPMAERRGLELEVERGDITRSVVLDRSRFRQVITNLLANALKFTREGHVRVRLGRLDDGEGIRLQVEDTGPGIPAEKREKIFEPFFRVNETGPDAQEGSGLGLAITVRLIRAMGGSLHVESEVGKGSTFTVEIPCEFRESAGVGDVAAEEEEMMMEEGAVEVPDLEILVADDHPANRTLIQHVLQQQGHAVVLAEDGVEAVEAFREKAFDVVVMDVQMPRMDGHQAIRRIRALPGGDRIPILTLTAYAMTGDRERSLAAGADDYISKPFDPKELLQRVHRLALKQQGSAPVQAAGFEDDPEMDALRRQYLHDLLKGIEGWAGRELDVPEMKMWAHRIAGSGGSFGYKEITAEARLIEAAIGEDVLNQQHIRSLLGRLQRKAREAYEALGGEEGR